MRARRVVDKYPELVFRAGYILEIFPDARILFVTRDGRAVARSVAAWNRLHATRNRRNTETWWGRDDRKWVDLWSQLIASDEYFAGVRTLDPARLDDLDRAALEWTVTMRWGLRAQRRHPGAILHVRYEDLIERPPETIERISSHCLLSYESKLARYALGNLRSPREIIDLSPGPAVDQVFQETMEALGYACGRRARA